MLKLSLPLLAALAAATGLALPANALPSCYMTQSDGSMLDLSHMCGLRGSDAGPSGENLGAVVPVATAPASFDEVWTRNSHFNNRFWNPNYSDYRSTSAISGNIHNSGPAMVENVVVEATGYAEGRTPQTRRTTVAMIGANDAALAVIDFGFSIPVESWDVRVVEWE
ncbi:MAG: hypothetical protein AAF282_13945 [Cyanobacteria bacterium P01_A01_bin.15]